jgi:DNA replication protein DnaT
VAGEWIKVETCTSGKAEIIRLARLLSVNRDEAIGMAVRFWVWADSNTVDGVVDGVASQDVDAVLSTPGLCRALEMVGWLQIDAQKESITIPKFARHNGESAKKRALKNERQARWRDGHVDAVVDAHVDTHASTREEKRREDIKNNYIVGQKKPDFRNQAVEILDFLNSKTGRHYKPGAANLEMIVARLRDGATVEECRGVIAKKCREWIGDADMNLYLRPGTLFNRTKFAQYQGELGAPHANTPELKVVST